jgi:hypothetical protein
MCRLVIVEWTEATKDGHGCVKNRSSKRTASLSRIFFLFFSFVISACQNLYVSSLIALIFKVSPLFFSQRDSFIVLSCIPQLHTHKLLVNVLVFLTGLLYMPEVD